MICCSTDSKGCSNVKWLGVSFLNNIQSSEEGLKVWKAYKHNPFPADNFSKYKMNVIPNMECILIISSVASPTI